MPKNVQTKYWLLKSEPDAFSFLDLSQKKNKTAIWDGVRNYQARNNLQAMQLGDACFFYHSSCAVPAIVGVVRVVKTAYPDPTQFDPRSPYFDSKAIKNSPRWFSVDVQATKELKELSLNMLRQKTQLAGMALLQRGSRLSVQPVSAAHWQEILKMGL